jgi:hypothetical protein
MELPASSDRAARTGWLLLLSLLLTFAASKAILYDTLDPDAFWHLRVADQLQREGIRPMVDHLSFATLKTPWTPYSWLGELAMKAIWDFGGFRAAIAVQSILIAGIFALVALAATRRGGSRIGVLICTFAAAYLSLPYLSFRPATASILLFAVAVWLLVRDRRLAERSRAVWLVIPLTAIAINVHIFASVIPLSIAALLAGAIWERRGIDRYAMLLALTTAACCATPMLPGLIRTMWFYQAGGSMVAASGIAELRPFYAGPMGWLSASIVAAGFVACWNGRDRLRIGEWLWLIGGTILLFRMGRFSPLFVIIAAPIVAVAMPTMSGAVLGKPAVRIALACLLCIGIGRIVAGFPARETSIDTWLNRNGPGTPGYPCDAAEYVEENIQPTTGRVLNEFSWGGYLDWRLGPTYRTFLDGRTQCFPPAFWQKTCMGSPADMLQAVKSVSADAAIVTKDKGSLRAAVVAMNWKRVYSDDRAEVFVPPSIDLADINEVSQ